MEYIVTGCKDCPFFNDGHDYEYRVICQHPYSKACRIVVDEKMEWGIPQEERFMPITPDWCPLNKESITIIKQ